MNQENEPDGRNEAQLRRKLVWAYGVIGVLTALLGWSLLEGGSDAPETAQTTVQGNPFDLCLQKLRDDQAAEAVPFCEQAVELQPDSLGAQHNLGYAYTT